MKASVQTFKKALFLGHAETQSGHFEEDIKYYEKVNSLTPVDILRVAKRYLLPEDRTVIIGVPK